MKSKLRKITIENSVYLYSVTNKYNLGTETNTLTIKIFLSEEKQTPLIIDFLTLDHYFVGQILNSGVNLMNKITNSIQLVNLNEPKYIKQLILEGKNQGWTGRNRIEKQNGLQYLATLGYEIDILLP